MYSATEHRHSCMQLFQILGGVVAVNQYFRTRLICLQFLRRAAIPARNNCTCNHSLSRDVFKLHAIADNQLMKYIKLPIAAESNYEKYKMEL